VAGDAPPALRYVVRPVYEFRMNPNEPSLAQRQVLSPTQLVAAARELLERGFPLLWLEGELSNFMRAKSGHLYFTLKDIGAQVRCAMFRPRAMHVRFQPADGQRVLLRARVTLYEPRGDFQLQVEHMEESGVGALQIEFERLKRRLEDGGLFAAERKRPLPALPRRIAVVTSPTGAAIRDVLAVLGRRYPLAEVDIYPSLVQGSEAPAALRRALLAADARRCYDVILLTRGGGSMEDLWAFNDEALARAIHASVTPVVSAVGHEVDFTIADFVADLRAPTPSVAAELIAPDQQQLRRQLAQFELAVQRHHGRVFERKAQRSDSALQRLQQQHPLKRLEQRQQKLENAHQRFFLAFTGRARMHAAQVQIAHTRLNHQHPKTLLRSLGERSQARHQALSAAVARSLSGRAERLRSLARTMNALNPLATLERGYAIAFDQHHQVLRNVGDVAIGSEISVRLASGSLRAKVQAVGDDAATWGTSE
jgi:exodeoxyribonuclease VII large subunit